MWVGQFQLSHKNCIHLTKCNKYNVAVSIFPLAHYIEDNYVYFTNINLLSGTQENISKYVEAFKNDKRTLAFEGKGNQYMSHLKIPTSDTHTITYFTNKMFLLQPIIHDKGHEDWLVGAWEKSLLTELYKNWSKFCDIRIQKIKKETVSNFFMPRLIPKLTNKQLAILDLAIRSGYYSFPKKIHLEQLAKKLKISRITLQEHLRKAEQKLMPFFIGNIEKE